MADYKDEQLPHIRLENKTNSSDPGYLELDGRNPHSPHTRRGRHRIPIWAAVLLVLVVVFVTTAFGAWHYFESKLNRLNFTDGEEIADIAKQEYLNILLLGTDERTAGGTTKDFSDDLMVDARADACMLLSLNLKNHTARLVSLERAIGVPIPGREDDWLTHAFRYGGANLMLKTVQEQFGIDVKRYVRVNVSSAAQLIDAIGGVDIELTATEAAALNGEIYTNSTTRQRVHEGLNHLDGYDALAYARQRFIDDDWHRVQRQRNVLQAAIEQTKDLNLKGINRLLDEALPLVETNFTKKEIQALLPKAPGFLGVQFGQMTLPLKGTYSTKKTSDGRSLMWLDWQENRRILNEFFFGTFDLETYQVPDEVQQRVWQTQQQNAYEWNLAHPVPPEEKELPDDSLEDSDVESSDASYSQTDEVSSSSEELEENSNEEALSPTEEPAEEDGSSHLSSSSDSDEEE